MRTHDVYLATSVEDVYIACSLFLQDVLKKWSFTVVFMYCIIEPYYMGIYYGYIY